MRGYRVIGVGWELFGSLFGMGRWDSGVGLRGRRGVGWWGGGGLRRCRRRGNYLRKGKMGVSSATRYQRS